MDRVASVAWNELFLDYGIFRFTRARIDGLDPRINGGSPPLRLSETFIPGSVFHSSRKSFSLVRVSLSPPPPRNEAKEQWVRHASICSSFQMVHWSMAR